LMQKVLMKTHLVLLNCLAALLVVLAITHFAVHYPSSLVMNSLIIDSAFIVFALCVWRYLYSRLKKGWNI
ncbi:MAG: PepSY domain-containing protein, partial [Pseudomonadota bacterium]|nr:PepSY domain-containing protein [Pseudomonadota bacterium]